MLIKCRECHKNFGKHLLSRAVVCSNIKRDVAPSLCPKCKEKNMACLFTGKTVVTLKLNFRLECDTLCLSFL